MFKANYQYRWIGVLNNYKQYKPLLRSLKTDNGFRLHVTSLILFVWYIGRNKCVRYVPKIMWRYQIYNLSTLLLTEYSEFVSIITTLLVNFCSKTLVTLVCIAVRNRTKTCLLKVPDKYSSRDHCHYLASLLASVRRYVCTNVVSVSFHREMMISKDLLSNEPIYLQNWTVFFWLLLEPITTLFLCITDVSKTASSFWNCL